MLIDGEKWACEACVRGHRVSNCQHADRPLQHINKKGRPVSQCQHCRAMRKSRSSHAKCDCGEKTNKCSHLQQTVEGHKDSCCCNHGGRCTCTHKKEPSLDTVPESESEAEVESLPTKPKSVSRRRRANTTHSEPVLSFDENGHHKPTHRHAKASQKSGPYTLNRGSSIHSTSSTGSLGSGSVDSLIHPTKSSGRSRATSSSSSSGKESRLTKSAHASPSIDAGSPFQQLNGRLPPLDLSNVRFSEYSPSFDLFSGISDHDAPMFSAGLTTSVDWTQYDGLEMNGENFTPSSYGPAQSYTGFDLAGSTEPTLTSNSGDVSESDDFTSTFSESHLDTFGSNSSNTTGNYLGLSQNQPPMLTSNDLSNLDFDQFKGTAATSKFLSNQSSVEDASSAFPFFEEDGFWGMNNFNDGITQSPDPVASTLWDTV
ncbi:hypothetical protein F4779DRAFT_627965 [Xylariaceae sp. FL0662B]|nr:hypothetical protein F4779DRAFT_627965 [Xylariaceae sp. FL0662B]